MLICLSHYCVSLAQAACRRLEHEGTEGDGSGFRRSLRPMFGRTMYLLATQKPGGARTFAICRPNTGASYFDMEVLGMKQPARCLAFQSQETQPVFEQLVSRRMTISKPARAARG